MIFDNADNITDGWEIRPLSAFASVKMGQSPPSSTYNYFKIGLPFFQGRKDFGQKYPTASCYCSKPTKIVEKGDVLLSIRAPIGDVNIANERSCIGRGLAAIRMKNGVNEFLYYLMRFNSKKISNIYESKGTVFGCMTKDDLENLQLLIPTNEKEQKAIALILATLDEKIQINKKMNKTLEAIGQALFKHWFVDFEFPDEQGRPYRSSGGNMVESELGEIPEGWEVKRLNEISINYDSQRIPLSSREREKRQGDYPYYGAAGILDYIDDYIFDGKYLLMGEDGTVIDERGYPVLQLVEGKFWVNNHAHVLQGNGISTELLYLFLKNTKVQHIVTGAVQPKINQKNMNALTFVVPSRDSIARLQPLIVQLFSKVKLNNTQSLILSQIRDALLPKLMSGKIRVPISDNASGSS